MRTRTAQVPVLNQADIVDLYASRVVVEEAALRELASRGVVPPEAEIAHRELQVAAEQGEPTTYARADIAFHRALVLGHGSPRLARMHALIMGEIELCIGQVDSLQLITVTEVSDQHQGILDAIMQADSERAGALTREHILMSRDRLLQHLGVDRGLEQNLPHEAQQHERQRQQK